MINKDAISELVLKYQNWPLPNLIERELAVPLGLPIKRAITVIGPRRCGKTYFLFSLLQKLLARKIPKERTLYLNFEEPLLSGATLLDLPRILDVFYEIYPQNQKRKIYLFFDEIQNIPQWERFIRSTLDSQNAQIFLSGSSSRLLSSEIATSMRGRNLSFFLLPFSFKEFLLAKNFDFAKVPRQQIFGALRQYLTFGGYPETLFFRREKDQILREIINTTIYQDIVERHEIRNLKIIKIMFDYLIRSKEFSVHGFYNFLKSLGLKVSKGNLYNYLEFFQEAFVFFPLRRFGYSLKTREQTAPKIYCVDNGLIEYVLGADKGKKFENAVFLSLLQQGLLPNEDFFYWADGTAEVDFIVTEKGKKPYLIQACSDIGSYGTREREARSILIAAEKLKVSRLLIINPDYEAEEKINGKTISFIPLWKWLLEGK